MASYIIQIERWQGTDMAFVCVRGYGVEGADKDIIRPLDWNILEGLPVPAEHRIRAGALISLMFKFSERVVSQIELRYLDYTNFWTAAAQIDERDERDEGQVVYRRGIGETLIDALVDLAFDVQTLD